MKKLLLILLLSISVVFLSSCSQHPFRLLPDTELLESDTIEFNYYNGKNTQKLFEYTFSNEYFFFVGLVDRNYRFTAINNYKDISDEFVAFLQYYDEYIVYDRFLNTEYTDELRLSLGANESRFNLTSVSIDDDVYDVDAFMSIDNGLRIIFSYTEFYSDDELIIVPYYLSIQTYDIHEAYLKEYLPVDNDYVLEKAILTKYVTHIIPLPPKIGILPSTLFEEDSDLKNLGHYMKIVQDPSDSIPHTEEVCTEEITENCFEVEYTSLSGWVYEWGIGSVRSFYEDNYEGRYINDDYIFTFNDQNYLLVLGSGILEVDTTDGGYSEDIVNIEISIYNE